MNRLSIPKYILAGCFSLGLLSSCELDETPYSSIYTETFYRTGEDAEAALAAIYSDLASLYGGPAPLMISGFSADQIYPRPVVGRETYTLFNYDPNYTTVKSFSRTNESPISVWDNCYQGIEKANWILAKVPETNMDEARKQELLAETYFLRAFFFWMLAKNFGDVVVKTSPSTSLEEAFVGISPKAEVYAQIYADLDKAEAGLPDYASSMPKGRPSKQVAQALYAKAALYNEDWERSSQKAQEVINSGRYALMENVLDVYDVSKEDLARQENMWAFEAESATPSRSSQIMGLCGPRNSDGPAYGNVTFGSIFVYPAFYASFDPADERRQLMATSYINREGQEVPQSEVTPITPHGILVKKYMDPNSVSSSHAVNIPILRLADVYLIAAEAEARQNGPTAIAYSYLNEVRGRAGLEGLPEGLSQEAFVNAVLQERSWELFAEGDRWYDLTRTNTFMEVIPQAVNDVFPARSPQPKHRYFPIPLDEVNANPELEQNPDWN